MTGAEDRRIPLTILGGFLGSGKTTWLRHQLHRGRMTDALVIVNEAAEVPVDDVILSRSADIRVLAGGCACCEARAGLIALLREICDRRVDGSHVGTAYRHIVLETSGLADPGSIVEAIRGDPVLLHHIVVREIIVAVDALHILHSLESEPLCRRQIETADRLVITKVDAVPRDDLRRPRATLAALNPGAVLSGAAMGSEVPLPEVGDAAPMKLPAFGKDDAVPAIATTLRLAADADWTAFGLWLSALLHARGDDLVRVKGVVRTPSGRLLLQSVRKVVQSPEILPEHATAAKGDNRIVFIGRGFRPEHLGPSLQRFAGVNVVADAPAVAGGA